jgi:hypothetical protein
VQRRVTASNIDDRSQEDQGRGSNPRMDAGRFCYCCAAYGRACESHHPLHDNQAAS